MPTARHWVPDGTAGLPIEQVGVVASTMTLARERITLGLERPTMFVASEQTGGYGRHGRAWSSPPGGHWSTTALLWQDNTPPTALGLRIGAACARAILALVPELAERRLAIKWPNDLLVDGRKVCGVLCESASHAGRSWWLIGVGINANNSPDDLPEGLRRPATSISAESGRHVDLQALAQLLSQEIAGEIRSRRHADTLGFAASMLWMLDQRVIAKNPSVHLEGNLRGLTDEGLLVIDTAAGRAIAPPDCELSAP